VERDFTQANDLGCRLSVCSVISSRKFMHFVLLWLSFGSGSLDSFPALAESEWYAGGQAHSASSAISCKTDWLP